MKGRFFDQQKNDNARLSEQNVDNINDKEISFKIKTGVNHACPFYEITAYPKTKIGVDEIGGKQKIEKIMHIELSFLPDKLQEISALMTNFKISDKTEQMGEAEQTISKSIAYYIKDIAELTSVLTLLTPFIPDEIKKALFDFGCSQNDNKKFELNQKMRPF